MADEEEANAAGRKHSKEERLNRIESLRGKARMTRAKPETQKSGGLCEHLQRNEAAEP